MKHKNVVVFVTDARCDGLTHLHTDFSITNSFDAIQELLKPWVCGAKVKILCVEHKTESNAC